MKIILATSLRSTRNASDGCLAEAFLQSEGGFVRRSYGPASPQK